MNVYPAKNHLYSLTVLRFFAAFIVFGFHFFSFPEEHLLLRKIFSQGFLGVDFFFILSGFVLAYSYFESITLHNNFTTRKFLINRFARIAPVYYLALFFSIPALLNMARALSSLDRFLVWTTLPLSLTFTQSFTSLYITQGYWNIPSWSLSVEFFFYCLFPLLSLPLIKSPHTKIFLFFLFLLNILVYQFAGTLPETISFSGHVLKSAWRTLPLYHLSQFLIGNSLAVLFLKKVQLNLKQSLFIIAASALLVVIFYSNLPQNHLIHSGHPLIVAVFSAIIFATASLDKYISAFIPKILILLGEASYSLYIFQAPIKLLLQQIWSKIFNMNSVVGFLYIFYISFFTILFSVVIYKCIEIKLRKKILNSHIFSSAPKKAFPQK